MCLIVLNWQPQDRQWLSLSANRDEFYPRPASALEEWKEYPGLFAGRDLQQGGTWLGATKAGRFAALTNIRAPGVGPAEPQSRGHLVLDYLREPRNAEKYLRAVLEKGEQYAPFNLLCGNRNQLWYASNYPEPRLERLEPGIHTLSNAWLNTPWPKTELARTQLQHWLQQPKGSASLAALLDHYSPFPDDQLPQTGVPLEWERLLSAQFINAPGYGTRCSTGILGLEDRLELSELSWDSHGRIAGRVTWPVDLERL